MEVDLPVGLRVGRERQVLAGLLAGDPRLQPLLVDAARQTLQVGLRLGELVAGRPGDQSVGSLTIGGGLAPPFIVVRRLHRVDGERVAGGVFVDARRAVADPLPPAVHRHADDEFQLRHLERGGVGVPQQVADQLPIVAHPAGALAIAHPRGLHDRAVIPHAVDQGDEAVVEHRQLFPPQALEEGGPVGAGTAVGDIAGGGTFGGGFGRAHRVAPAGRNPHRMGVRPPAVNPSPAVPAGAWPVGGRRPIS